MFRIGVRGHLQGHLRTKTLGIEVKGLSESKYPALLLRLSTLSLLELTLTKTDLVSFI